jgi:hypothetical protein
VDFVSALRQARSEWLERVLGEAGPVAPKAIVAVRSSMSSIRASVELHGFEDFSDARRVMLELSEGGKICELGRVVKWTWHKREPKEGPTDAQ